MVFALEHSKRIQDGKNMKNLVRTILKRHLLKRNKNNKLDKAYINPVLIQKLLEMDLK